MIEQKPYLSPSQIGMILRCPEQYRRRYLMKEKIPPGIAMIKGGAVHAAVAHNFHQKIESHEDLPVNDIVEVAVSEISTRIEKEGVLLGEDEVNIGQAKIIGTAKDSAIILAKLHTEQVAPKIQPVLVEEKIKIEMPNCEYDLLGILDLADDQNNVRDLKVSGKSKSQDEADNSFQLTTYAACYYARQGELPSTVILDVLVEKKQSEYQELRSIREQGHFIALANTFAVIERMLKAGVFVPRPAQSKMDWWCSPRFCGYHATCQFIKH